MAFVIEDGTGLETATSYISEADADTYVTDYAYDASTWSTQTSGEKERLLNLGTRYIDSEYHARWQGTKISTSQALDFPRCQVYDNDNNLIASDEVPQKIKDAVVEAAIRLITTNLFADIEADASIKKEKVVVGPIEQEVEYVGGDAPTTTYTIIDNKVSDFVTGSRTNITLERS